jgi:hypothetical protein
MQCTGRIALIEFKIVPSFYNLIEDGFEEECVFPAIERGLVLSLDLAQFEQRLMDIMIGVELENNLADPPRLLLLSCEVSQQLGQTAFPLLGLACQTVQFELVLDLEDKSQILLQDLIATIVFILDNVIQIERNFSPLCHLVSLDLDKREHEFLTVQILLLEDATQTQQVLQEVVVVVDG